MTANASIGHNNPPPDLKVGEALREELAEQHAAMLKRRDDLLASASDFLADHPIIDDDETSGFLAGVLSQITAHVKVAEKTHGGVKAPWLEGSRIVDNFFFKGVAEPLKKKHGELNAMQTAYLNAKADKARREQQERERLAREEEDRKRREAEKAERERRQAEAAARKAGDDAEAARQAEARRLDADRRAAEAREAQERARTEKEAAAKIAASSAADRSRTRGDVAMTSLRTTWKFDVVDLAQVPAQYLQINSAAVNAAIKGENGLRSIPGLRIFADTQAQNR